MKYLRFILLPVAMLVGYCAAQYVGGRHLAMPSWWPDRERDRNVRYFRDVLEVVNESYVDEKATGYDQLTRDALRGMLSQLDPHSEYLGPEDFAAMNEELNNEFGGIGIQVEQRDNAILVVTLMADSPAEHAGLWRGDRLHAVDGQSLEGVRMDEVIKLIRGEPGTNVKLTVLRPSHEGELTFNLRRERIRMQSVRNASLGDDGLGYIEITQFSERTGEEFAASLRDLERRGLRALVLDLRNNPGGLLDAAIDVCDEFFNKGELVAYTQGRAKESREDFLAQGRHPLRNYPVAILVNGGTASAAEIVTGAMKDTHRAFVVGEKTFGKGSVQTVMELREGEGVRLTTARYYTPSGVTIHEHGVPPDVELVVSLDDESKLRLQQSRTDLPPTEFEARFGFKPIADVQRDAAQELLRGVLAQRAKP